MKLHAALAISLIALLLPWTYSLARYPATAEWAQCHATVVTSDQHSPIESFYQPLTHTLYIGTEEDSSVPYYAGLIILLHEVGHCLQDESGWLDAHPDTVERELDADRRSADLACGMGLDGRRLLHDTFVWAHDRFDYNGDEDHGSLAERISQGDNAQACDHQYQEA